MTKEVTSPGHIAVHCVKLLSTDSYTQTLLACDSKMHEASEISSRFKFVNLVHLS